MAESARAWRTWPCTAPLQGDLPVPGDKSVSHRAVMFASVAEGVSHVRGFLEGEDTRATARIMQQLGVRIDTLGPGERRVHGVGLQGLRAPQTALDCGNSGTGMRLMAGLLAGQSFAATLVGDASLSGRPMARIAEPLRQMGAKIALSETCTAPIRIAPAGPLHGVRYRCPVASAQVKSAVLLAGLYAEGETEVVEPHPTRDYTESLLAAMGADIDYAPGVARLRGGRALRAIDFDVPGDVSSAAFALVAATLVPGSQLLLPRIGLHPRRNGLLTALRLMGASVEETIVGPGLVDLAVASRPLRAIDVPEDLVPDMIDEFPVLFVAAACADGVTRIRGAAELRVKESDRIARMAEGLRALGIRVDETPDGADIHGGRMTGGRVASGGDHRIAMAFAVAGQCATGPVEIDDVANVETSYPGFAQQLPAIGIQLDVL